MAQRIGGRVVDRALGSVGLFLMALICLASDWGRPRASAREKYDHFALRAHLKSLGISLRSATEPIDDTSAGKLRICRAGQPHKGVIPRTCPWGSGIVP